jgi:hypothetical protein
MSAGFNIEVRLANSRDLAEISVGGFGRYLTVYLPHCQHLIYREDLREIITRGRNEGGEQEFEKETSFGVEGEISGNSENFGKFEIFEILRDFEILSGD